MPVNPTYPGIYVEELPNQAHTITPAPTSITVFVGYANPLQGKCATDVAGDWWGKAIRIFSFADYELWFGGLFHHSLVSNDLAYAVFQFFQNGGSDAYVLPLKPQYYDGNGNTVAQPAIVGAAIDIGGITFTAKQLTDTANRITISIRNVRDADLPQGSPVPAHKKADISITFGRFFETYRDVETYAHISSATDANFIANKLKGSVLVSVSPTPTGGAYPNTFPAANPPIDLWDMRPPAGAGTTSIADYQRAFSPNQPLDKVEIFNLLATPGESNPTVWSTALQYCASKRAFYIMDPPENAAADASFGTGTTQIEEHVKDVSFPKDPPNGALYFPYLKGNDPLRNDGFSQPPSGFVAGIFARTDLQRGVWKAPAGLEATVFNTRGVVETGRMTDMRQGVLNNLGVNCFREFSGSTVIWGSRTVSTSNKALEQWKYVPVRRMALFIEQTLIRNLGWVVFEPNARPLWNAITVSIEGFMLALYRQQAFFGDTPSAAFRVQCDQTTTTDEDINNGIVNIFVGFRPLKPAEFVVIKIAQLAGQVQT